MDKYEMAQKIANALVDADVDCIKICNSFGGGCYWSCSQTEKVKYIKQWILGVVENE